MGRMSRLGNALYEGDVSIDFVGRKWLWYSISGLIIVLAAAGSPGQGAQLRHRVQGRRRVHRQPRRRARSPRATSTRSARRSPTPGSPQPPRRSSTPRASRSGCRPRSSATRTPLKVTTAIADAVGRQRGPRTSRPRTSGRAGAAQVAQRALTGLIVFLVLVVLFIWAYFREWKMSMAAIVALIHDIVITIGVYALLGLRGHPGDGHRPADHPRLLALRHRRRLRQGAREHQEPAAEPQDLRRAGQPRRSTRRWCARSTPRSSRCCRSRAILYVGVTTLGSGALKDLSLALFVGMAAGAYSSIFIATPLAVQLKSREKEITEQDARAKARARRDVDRYADVPVFTDDMPLRDERRRALRRTGPRRRPARPGGATPVQAPPRRPEASGSGRVVPQPKRPSTDGGSSGRTQPTRQPRSKRGR